MRSADLLLLAQYLREHTARLPPDLLWQVREGVSRGSAGGPQGVSRGSVGGPHGVCRGSGANFSAQERVAKTGKIPPISHLRSSPLLPPRPPAIWLNLSGGGAAKQGLEVRVEP
eukprot:4032674-Pyramimonas_sp.AAC.1